MQVKYKLNGHEVTREEFAEAGERNRLAAMLASGRAPGCQTDREFLLGHCNENQFEGSPAIGDLYRKQAAAAGVSVKGKVYKSGLAAFPGDPRAWVDGRGDVQRLCEERGWQCEGAVNVPMDQDKVAIPTGGGVAPDLIAAEAEVLAEETGVPLEEATETVYEARKPHWVK